MKKLSFKYVGLFSLLFLAAFLFDSYKIQLLTRIKDFFQWEPLFYGVTIFVFLTVVINKIKYGELTVTSFTDQKKIKGTLSDLLSWIIDPSSFVCSLSILKGLFLDSFFGGAYFSSFTTSERVFILIASAFFFINSFIELKKDFTGIILNTEEPRANEE